jgi:predicted kinase
MEMILLIGIQATGKSSFCRERLFNTHVRVNLDMLKSRHREELLLRACLEGKTPFVVDKMNLTREQRAPYICRAKAAGFEVVGYFFASRLADALLRNAQREGKEHIQEAGIRAASGQLQLPSLAEGFDRLFFVRMDGRGAFAVNDWRDEV